MSLCRPFPTIIAVALILWPLLLVACDSGEPDAPSSGTNQATAHPEASSGTSEPTPRLASTDEGPGRDTDTPEPSPTPRDRSEVADGDGTASVPEPAPQVPVPPAPPSPPAPSPAPPPPAVSSQLSHTSAETDREVLVAFYNATDGPNWGDNKNWLGDEPSGKWTGVTTDASGRVTEFLLSEAYSGKIPAELGDLTELERLVLRHNYLTGTIPPELGNLSNLEEMDLSDNNLGGAIPPELGNLVYLEEMDLSNNNLGGGRYRQN